MLHSASSTKRNTSLTQQEGALFALSHALVQPRESTRNAQAHLSFFHILLFFPATIFTLLLHWFHTAVLASASPPPPHMPTPISNTINFLAHRSNCSNHRIIIITTFTICHRTNTCNSITDDIHQRPTLQQQLNGETPFNHFLSCFW